MRLPSGGRIIAAASPSFGEPGADVAYYEPDAAGMMEVLAECGKHYTHQPQVDLLAGIGAHCGRCHRPTEQACKTCLVIKPMMDYHSVGNGRRRRHCKACVSAARVL